jgi:hypothetical protein
MRIVGMSAGCDDDVGSGREGELANELQADAARCASRGLLVVSRHEGVNWLIRGTQLLATQSLT